jgi:elongator complex protein 1
MIKYVDTILTTHVCKDPPDLESGLRVLLRLKSKCFSVRSFMH